MVSKTATGGTESERHLPAPGASQLSSAAAEGHAHSAPRPTRSQPRPCPRGTIALVGPRPDSRGGVAATLRAISDSPLSRRYRIVTVATYCDGPRWRKALQASRGLLSLAWLAARGDLGLVHLHAATGASFTRKVLALAIARAVNRPVVLHVHGGAIWSELQGSRRRGAVRRREVRWALERADTVVALTPGWADKLARSARIRRLRVVPNVPDLDKSVGPPNAYSRAQPPIVLFLGHLYREKGVFEVVDAFARARRRHPQLALVMAGEGTEGETIRAYAEELGLDGAIELPGWVGSEAKAELLARASCFVLPSYEEGLPLALLEAMASGVPIVATPVGGVPDVVREGLDALLVPPRDAQALGDAVIRILDDPRLGARLAQSAKRRVAAEYSLDVLAQRLMTIYDELLPRGTA